MDDPPPSNVSLLDACKHVYPPVSLDSPAHLLALCYLLQKVLFGFQLTLLLLQGFPQVTHVR